MSNAFKGYVAPHKNPKTAQEHQENRAAKHKWKATRAGMESRIAALEGANTILNLRIEALRKELARYADYGGRLLAENKQMKVQLAALGTKT